MKDSGHCITRNRTTPWDDTCDLFERLEVAQARQTGGMPQASIMPEHCLRCAHWRQFAAAPEKRQGTRQSDAFQDDLDTARRMGRSQ